MNRLTTRYRATAVAVVVAAIAAIVGLAPHLGFTSTTAPLWSDRAVAVSPGATVPAPNWVELARTLKPAVVNISTKRVEQQTPMENAFGGNEQLREFFKQFGMDKARAMAKAAFEWRIVDMTPLLSVRGAMMRTRGVDGMWALTGASDACPSFTCARIAALSGPTSRLPSSRTAA